MKNLHRLIVLGALVPLGVMADPTIFDVRKNLPMSNTETVYRDFYVNGGTEVGLSAGMVLIVQRRMPLYDSYQNRSAGDLQLKVAKVKIIHAQKGLAVARLHSEFTREGTPLLEDNFIMVGDQLDLSSATSDKKADNGPAAAPGSEPAGEPARDKVAAQIIVNSIQLSSEAPKPTTAQAPAAPAKVDVPHLE